jgi:hypothetical protein
MGADTLPGTDGLNPKFFQQFWNLIRPYYLQVLDGEQGIPSKTYQDYVCINSQR